MGHSRVSKSGRTSLEAQDGTSENASTQDKHGDTSFPSMPGTVISNSRKPSSDTSFAIPSHCASTVPSDAPSEPRMYFPPTAARYGSPMEPPCAAPRNLNPNEPTIYGPNEPCRANPTPSRYAPPQIPGPRLYRRFYVKTHDLLKEIRCLQFALKTIGGAGPTLVATEAIWASFKRLIDLFGYNAHALFPITEDPRIKLPQGSADWLDFQIAFSQAASALQLMNDAFKSFQSAYYDYHSIYRLNDLRKRFEEVGRRNYTSTNEEVRRRVQSFLGSFLIRDVEALRKDLNSFCEEGVPIISSSQEAQSNRYLNLTTISTFLSAVTAIFLPVSAEQPVGALNISVNTLLFASLTFSIASAINSLLAVSWSKSIVHAPDSHLQLWVTACINTGPMFSLITSAALFVAGLCLFVFASNQHPITSIVTVAFSGLYTICILGLGAWLLLEKWRFRRSASPAVRGLMDFSLSMAIIDFVVLRRERTKSITGDGDCSEFENGMQDGAFPFNEPYSPLQGSSDAEFVQMQDGYMMSSMNARVSHNYPIGKPSIVYASVEPALLGSADADGPIGQQDVLTPKIIVRASASADFMNDSGHGNERAFDETCERGRSSLDENRGTLWTIAEYTPVDSHEYDAVIPLPMDEVTGVNEETIANPEGLYGSAVPLDSVNPQLEEPASCPMMPVPLQESSQVTFPIPHSCPPPKTITISDRFQQYSGPVSSDPLQSHPSPRSTQVRGSTTENVYVQEESLSGRSETCTNTLRLNEAETWGTYTSELPSHRAARVDSSYEVPERRISCADLPLEAEQIVEPGPSKIKPEDFDAAGEIYISSEPMVAAPEASGAVLGEGSKHSPSLIARKAYLHGTQERYRQAYPEAESAFQEIANVGDVSL